MFVAKKLGKNYPTPRQTPNTAMTRDNNPDVPRTRAETLIRGLPGHPLHPPLTDATIGMFVLATGLAVIGYAGAIESKAAPASWLALIGGLGVAVPTALTGFIDWLYLEWGSARWGTATWHLSAMVTAVALFALAAWRQHPGYEHGNVTTAGLVLSLAGLVVLSVGGWLGGSVVFVHGTRVIATRGPQPPDVGEGAGGGGIDGSRQRAGTPGTAKDQT